MFKGAFYKSVWATLGYIRMGLFASGLIRTLHLRTYIKNLQGKERCKIICGAFQINVMIEQFFPEPLTQVLELEST